MEIAQRTFTSKQTVSAVTKNYLEKGLVRLTEVASDRRNKLVQLTEKGRQYAKSVIQHVTQAEVRATAQLTEEQQKALLETTAIFSGHLKRYMEEE